MIRKLITAAVPAIAAGTVISCSSLPFSRQPAEQPVVEEMQQQEASPKPKRKPAKPPAPVAQANAYYETGAASTSFFVTRPKTSRTDRLPDKILRRGSVVQLLVPKAGEGWSKVKLVDAQTGYVPLSDLDVVAKSVRPTGFPKRGVRGIDTGGELELPEPPTAASPVRGSGPGDSIDLDGMDLEPSDPLSLPDSPGSPGGIDNISLDDPLEL